MGSRTRSRIRRRGWGGLSPWSRLALVVLLLVLVAVLRGWLECEGIIQP